MSKKLKVLIITCWVVYIACLIIKLCGGNWFEIATTNETFIAICDYIDNTLWLKMIIATIIYVISTYIIYLSLTKQRLFKDLRIIPILIGINIINIYFNNVYVNIVLSLIVLLVIPLIRTKFKERKNILVGVILIFLFQLISLITRNIGWNLNNQSMLVSLIMQIDYYIIVIIYYLYTNRKEIK